MKTKLLVFSAMLFTGGSFFAEAEKQVVKKEDKKSRILKYMCCVGAGLAGGVAISGIAFCLWLGNSYRR